MDSFIDLVAGNFWLVFLFYWVFLLRPRGLLLGISALLALLLVATALSRAEEFQGYFYSGLSSAHLLPDGERLRVLSPAGEDPNSSFVSGFYYASVLWLGLFFFSLPTIGLLKQSRTAA